MLGDYAQAQALSTPISQVLLIWGGVFAGLILAVTLTVAGYYLRYIAGHTPAELFLMLPGVRITCYLASLGLLLGADVTARVQLGHRLGNLGGRQPPGERVSRL